MANLENHQKSAQSVLSYLFFQVSKDPIEDVSLSREYIDDEVINYFIRNFDGSKVIRLCIFDSGPIVYVQRKIKEGITIQFDFLNLDPKDIQQIVDLWDKSMVIL